MKIDSRVLIWGLALSSAVLLSILFCTVYAGYSYDVYMRYAPMADEFAAGNWREAFHPRYGVFMSAVAGSVAWCFGVSGITACRIVSTCGWCLAMIPVWHFSRKAYGEEAAWIAVALMFVIPQYWFYSSAGLRDGVRILSYALIAWGLLSGSAWVAVGIFIQVTLRVDGIAIASTVWAACIGLATYRRRFWTVIAPTATLALGLLLNSLMVNAFTGHFLPASQLIPIFGRWL